MRWDWWNSKATLAHANLKANERNHILTPEDLYK
jgi:hypothetical protein